jgi:hypothetical protein
MRPFEVTTPKTTTALGSDGKTDVTFSVSNVSGQPLRANFVVLPDDPKNASSLSVVGNPSFDFSKDSALTQVVTRVAPPASAPPGTISFKLRALSAERPDDDYTDSPTVAVTVGRPAKKPFPWWIIVAIVAVLLVVGGVLWFVLRPKPAQTVAVPNVVTEPRARAASDIAAAGLTMVEGPLVAGAPTGVAASQNPTPAAPPVARGSSVTVSFYGDSALVPGGLVGNPWTTALSNTIPMRVSVCGNAGSVVTSVSPGEGQYALKSDGVYVRLNGCFIHPIWKIESNTFIMERRAKRLTP